MILKRMRQNFSVLVEQDQILACRVLQLANSPAYGARYPLESLQQAISWLGINFLASTAFSFSVQTGVFHVEGYEQEVKGLWAHTLAVGLYAKAIAARLGQNPDMAFLCGLLHAIGKPYVTHTVNVYQHDLEERYSWTVLDKVIQESYIEAGRQLAIGWDLPEPVQETIMFHEDLAYEKVQSKENGPAITCLARYLATALFHPTSIDGEGLVRLAVARYLGVGNEDMAIWLEQQDAIRASVTPMLV